MAEWKRPCSQQINESEVKGVYRVKGNRIVYQYILSRWRQIYWAFSHSVSRFFWVDRQTWFEALVSRLTNDTQTLQNAVARHCQQICQKWKMYHFGKPKFDFDFIGSNETIWSLCHGPSDCPVIAEASSNISIFLRCTASLLLSLIVMFVPSHCEHVDHRSILTVTAAKRREHLYGCFHKWWYPQNTPTWSFSIGTPMVVGYHHFRKHPLCFILI